MIIGAEVRLGIAAVRAHVIKIVPNGTLDVIVYGTGQRVNVPRTSVRWPTADERDKGSTESRRAILTGLFIVALIGIVALAPKLHGTPVPVPTPMMSAGATYATSGYMNYPDCAWSPVPCVSDDEKTGSVALHDGEHEPMPFIVVDSWLDSAGHRWWGGTVSTLRTEG